MEMETQRADGYLWLRSQSAEMSDVYQALDMTPFGCSLQELVHILHPVLLILWLPKALIRILQGKGN